MGKDTMQHEKLQPGEG